MGMRVFHLATVAWRTSDRASTFASAHWGPKKKQNADLGSGTHSLQNLSPHMSFQTDHKELAEGDVGENVVGLVLATGVAGLLPEV